MRHKEIIVVGAPFLIMVFIVLMCHELTSRAPEAEAIPAFAGNTTLSATSATSRDFRS